MKCNRNTAVQGRCRPNASLADAEAHKPENDIET